MTATGFGIRGWPRLDNPIAAKLIEPIEASVFVEPWPAARLEQVLDRRSISGLLCEFNCTVLGYLLFQRCPHVLNVVRMAVHPNWHRRGVGGFLIHALKTNVQRDGLTGIETTTHERNVTGQQFLKSVGFRCEKVLPGEGGFQNEEYLFRWSSPTAPAIAREHAPALCCDDDDD